MRSTTCKGTNGQYLEEYHNQAAAALAAEERLGQSGYRLAPYQCRACGYWHLAPVQTRRQCFLCSDSALFHKDIYPSREEAQKTADWMRKEKRIQVYPYRCPHGSGWHLTKRK